MKKTLIALAALAATGAFAQSTVTMSGVVGFGQQQVRGTTGFTNTDASFTLAASEDLGGGLRASASVSFDPATNGFGATSGNDNTLMVRNKSIALSGGFGSFSLINTRSGDLLTRGMVAPSYLPDGMYDSSGVIARAAVDVVQYTLPAMSGFAPFVQYVESGINGGLGDGNTIKGNRTYVLGGNYAAGPLTAGVAYKMAENKSTLVAAGVTTPAFTSHKNNLEAFVTYNLGVAMVGVGFDQGRYAGDKAATSFGVSVPMGALTLGANFASRQVGATPANDAATPVAAVASKKQSVTELVAKYDLSKRTSLNFSYGIQTADETATLDGKQHRLAVVHTF